MQGRCLHNRSLLKAPPVVLFDIGKVTAIYGFLNI